MILRRVWGWGRDFPGPSFMIRLRPNLSDNFLGASLNIEILSSTEEIAQAGADLYRDLLKNKPNAILGLATGSSPIPVYNELIRMYEDGEISFEDASAYLLDEYIGLPADHEQAYRNVISDIFTGQVNFAPGTVHSPAGDTNDPFKAAEEYEAQLEAIGGVDLQLLGLGTDGHIAFNEPGGSLSSKTHPQVLTDQTRIDNCRFFEDDMDRVPKFSITQGLATIMSAKKIVLVAQGKQKAEAVKQMIEGGVSAMWPATVLQWHRDLTLLLDEDAASELALADFYKTEAHGRHELMELQKN